MPDHEIIDNTITAGNGRPCVPLNSWRRIKEYDDLTGIYNQNQFLQKTEEMLLDHPQETFALIQMDINQFQLVNQFYGVPEADRLLQYIAGLLVMLADDFPYITYGRSHADVFCFCIPYKSEPCVIQLLERLRDDLNRYNLEHVLIPAFGIFVIDPRHPIHDIHMISDYANLAVKQCKGNYIQNYAFYDSSISERFIQEQKIVNGMKKALLEEEFVLYIQPKYDLQKNVIDGGEVLVRWLDAEKGVITPSKFIPVFEKNGFIMKLDYYVWEHACQIIRRWLDSGWKPYPISVNISRVSLYNPKLADHIIGLVEKYEIPPKLLQLELTESAYIKDPEAIKETMVQLQKYGFCILMDDFGSGYSSLNALKDIAVDILKIDMKFLSDTDVPGRGENILASVMRMAKWLNMPVIAEGVEKETQVAFLRSIGCEFVQGYFFSKPMPVDEYEQLAFHPFDFHTNDTNGMYDNKDALWDVSSQMEILFSNMLQAVAIYEYAAGSRIVDTIRVNNSYYDLFGYNDLDRIGNGIQNVMDADCRESVIDAFEEAARTKGVSQCEFRCTTETGRELWVEVKLKYVNAIGNRSVIFAVMADITDQKKIEQELRRYRKAIYSTESRVETILIVDDIEMNRLMLRNMFESEYNILEAENGREALEIIRKNNGQIDLILLDVIMPVMDGREFLEHKSDDMSIADIPVVVITSDDSPQQQINALSLGANDYVVKPFIPEVVIRRVCNVMQSRKHVGTVLQHTQESSGQDQHDYLTGLYNRNKAGQMILEAMQHKKGLQALLLIDIDNFHQVNERYGRSTGDKAIQDFADRLRRCFRKSDILARYGGDEFIVFVIDVPSRELIEKKCDTLIREMQLLVQKKNQKEMKLVCSIGIAIASAQNGQDSFMELIGYADKALNEAKNRGRNQWYVYEGK